MGHPLMNLSPRDFRGQGKSRSKKPHHDCIHSLLPAPPNLTFPWSPAEGRVFHPPQGTPNQQYEFRVSVTLEHHATEIQKAKH